MKSRVCAPLLSGALWQLGYTLAVAGAVAPRLGAFVGDVLDPVLPGGSAWIAAVAHLGALVGAGIAADDVVPQVRRRTTSVVAEIRDAVQIHR